MALVQYIETAVGKHNFIAQPSPELNAFEKPVEGKYLRLDFIGKNQGVKFKGLFF